MTQRLLAVGNPPLFRHQVAQAVDAEADSIEWVEEPDAARMRVAEARGDITTVVIAASIDEEDALELAVDVNDTFPTTAVVLVRETPMNGALPDAMRAGIRDVVDLSAGEDELEKALQRAMSWAKGVRVAAACQAPETPEGVNGLVISVFSSKGGTGKTFLSSNLAAALADRSGQETALLDLDLGMGDVFAYFGKEPARPIQDLLALGERGDRSTIVACGTKLATNLIGFGSPPDPGAPVVDSESVAPVIAALKATFPYVVVDIGAQYSDHAIAALDSADVVCLITGLDVVGVRHMSKALDTLVEIGIPKDRLRIVLNRADSKVGIESGDISRVLKVDVHSEIPSSRLVPTSLNKGMPVYSDEPRSEVAKSIGLLADSFISERVPAEEKQAVNSKRRMFRRS